MRMVTMPMTQQEKVVDLHVIGADIECDTCNLSMADVLIQGEDRFDIKAYHLPCLEDTDESN